MDSFEVGQALRRRRRAAGMTQADVARAMGSTQPAVSRAEAGRVMPSVRFLERYAWATGRMLSMDVGPPARMRGAGRRSANARSHTEIRTEPDPGDPVAVATARERAAAGRMDRGEISATEYASEKVLAELELAEALHSRV